MIVSTKDHLRIVSLVSYQVIIAFLVKIQVGIPKHNNIVNIY